MYLSVCAIWKYGLCMSAYNMQVHVCVPCMHIKGLKVGSYNKQLFVHRRYT